MRKQLSKSDIEKLNSEVESQFKVKDFFGKKDRIMLADENHLIFVLKDNEIVFFYKDGLLVPCLKFLAKNSFLKKVVVDMGAVKFVISGADVMRPGIVELDRSILKGELVLVVDQSHLKPLCVAQALFSSDEINALSSGKVLRNLHQVGDLVWKVVV